MIAIRYLDVRVDQPRDERNRMHQFVVEHDAYNLARLLYRTVEGDNHASLFHVAGPSEPYESVLAEGDGVVNTAVEPAPDGTCYCYVRETMSPADQNFAGAFDQPGLIVLTPVEYRSDGTVVVSAVGPAEAVQSAVGNIPDTMGVEVRSVGPYHAGKIDPGMELTPRQHEAVATAVDLGYYATPRESDLESVAGKLDCATGPAGELLRKAERTVMRGVTGGGPGYPRA